MDAGFRHWGLGIRQSSLGHITRVSRCSPGGRLRAIHRFSARKGLSTSRLVRYADDFVVLLAGTREQAEELRSEVAAVLQPMGLRLSENKTKVAHIDEGFDFLTLCRSN